MTTHTELPSKSRSPIVFACSGAADVGAIADRAARQLAKEGAGVMSCLAGVSAHAEPVMASAHATPAVVAIDGCPEDCAAKTLQSAGFTGIAHIRLSDLGLNKKESPPSDERVSLVVQACKTALNAK